jgi:hypothetical protein
MSGSEDYVDCYCVQITSYLEISSNIQFIYLETKGQLILQSRLVNLTDMSITCSSVDGHFVSFFIPNDIHSLFVTVPVNFYLFIYFRQLFLTRQNILNLPLHAAQTELLTVNCINLYINL